MISLNDWFSRYTRRPIWLASLVLLSVWSFASFEYVRSSSRHRDEVLGNVVRTLSLAVRQNNRVLIENVLDSALIQVGGKLALVCRGEVVIAEVNGNFGDCKGSTVEKIGVPGFEDYYLVIERSSVWAATNLWFVFGLGSIFILFCIFTLRRMQERFFSEIMTPLQAGVFQVESLAIAEFETFRVKMLEGQNLQTQVKVHEAMVNMAAQVSHDIRSPLTALNMAVAGLSSIPESERLIIRTSAQRIQDIANQLLKQSKVASLATVKAPETSAIQRGSIMLAALVDSIVTEKRLQYRESLAIHIRGDWDQGYGLFSRVDGSALARVVSNLINNSIEALSHSGEIRVKLFRGSESAVISVVDNGPGMSPEVLSRIGVRGVSFGKEGTQSGSGLGIYYAKSVVDEAGGQFEIFSTVGKGTEVRLSLPLERAPWWFVEKISLEPRMTIVSLDDDQSIHQVWATRFEQLQVSTKGIKHFSYVSIEKFEQWFSTEKSKLCLFLVDFEFLGQKSDGLDVIEKLGISSVSILITSRYDDEKIRIRANRLGVKMVPKGLAPFVPFEFISQSVGLDGLTDAVISSDKREVVQSSTRIRYDLCLIDDDTSLIHPVWASVAKSRGLSIRLFSCPQEFLSAASVIDQSTPVYIDVSLGPNISGVDFAHEVFKLGFTEISLATGYEPESIDAPSFIRRIIGKDFPDLAK